jgi:protein SCO1/2
MSRRPPGRSGPTAARSGRGGRVLLVALALLLAACAPATSTALAPRGLEPGPDGWRGLELEAGWRLPTTPLMTTDGRTIRLDEELAGTPALVFFGYTSCPDICPIHLATIASAMETTRTRYDRLRVVFIAVDPERDTPERIDEFLGHFDRRMLGLHGDLDTIVAALAELDLPGPVVEGPDPRGQGDLVGHPAQVIGFDASGAARRVWPFGARRGDWINDLPRIVAEWS